MKKLIAVIFALLLTIGAFSEIVKVEGYGLTITQAEEDAKRRALELVEGSYIKGITKVQDMQTVMDLVISRVEGFVKVKNILEKGCEGEGQTRTCRVVAEIEVIKKEIENRLNDLLMEAGEPSIGLLIAESYSPMAGKCGYPQKPLFFRGALKPLLIDEGLKVPGLEGLASYNEKLKQYGVSKKDLLDISLAAADIASYVLVAKVQFTGRYVPDYDVCSVRMNLEANLVRADTGDIVKSYSMNEVAAGATPEAAAKKIISKNVKAFARELAKDIYQDRVIRALSDKTLRIRFNLKSPDMASEILQCLEENLYEVKKITILNQLSDVLIVGVLTDMNASQLWEKVEKACSDEFELEIGRMSSKLIEVNVISQIAKKVSETLLKFKLEKFSLIKKVKSCLAKIQGIEIIGRTSFKPYTLKVRLNTEVEDLIDKLEECDLVNIELIDVAEDGSWFLFEVK